MSVWPLGSRPSASGAWHCKSIVGTANDFQYNVIAINRNGEAQGDDQLEEILNSFHFLGVPVFFAEDISIPPWPFELYYYWRRFYPYPIWIGLVFGVIFWCFFRGFKKK
jgi:hypothetical protein